MTFDHENAVKELQAKDEIRDLVFTYCEAIRNRDIESLVALYTPDAAFGSMGTGEEALRSMAEATMRELEFAVILITNHRIMFLNEREASGEVWARCYAQNKTEGYYEQIIKYTDQYELSKHQNLNKENSSYTKSRSETQTHCNCGGETFGNDNFKFSVVNESLLPAMSKLKNQDKNVQGI